MSLFPRAMAGPPWSPWEQDQSPIRGEHVGSSLGPCCRDGLDRKGGSGAVLQEHEYDRFKEGPWFVQGKKGVQI